MIAKGDKTKVTDFSYSLCISEHRRERIIPVGRRVVHSTSVMLALKGNSNSNKFKVKLDIIILL